MRSRATRIETSSIPGMLLVALAVWVTAPAGAVEGEGYGFYRTVQGDVQLTTLEQDEPLDVEPNYPLLLGDRIWVAADGRLEVVLPDQTIVRAGGSTDVYFEELALYAGEEESFGTTLRLLEGEIQVVVRDFEVEREPLRVDTNNATLYLQEAGTYRIYADSRQWTELVVREGFGEVALEDGSVVVRADEEAVVDGGPDARVKVYPAGALDALEAWGQDLESEASAAARESYVDEELRYSAAPLDRHGEWLPVASGHAWRPYGVAAAWRPYTRGYWTHTPGGLYWVSGEPWGAVTAHYGSWSPHPRYGWLWHPGSLFAPAWVHWYWGSTHVGWIPSGYYSHHYGGRYGHRYGHGYGHAGLRFGVYGYSSGGWGLYGSWTFCPTRYFGWRSYHSTWRSGHEIARTARHEAPRGLITNHTGGLPRRAWSRPDEVVHHLTRGRGQIESSLGDVTDFVARQPRLDGRIEQAVFAGPNDSRSPLRTARRSPSSLRSAPDRSLEIERSAIEHERGRAVASEIRSSTRRSLELENRAAEIERGMPARAERSRGRLLTSGSLERRPSMRSSPGTTRIERSEPVPGRTTEPIIRSVRPPSADFRTRESLRTPTAIDLERRVSAPPSARSPMEYIRQTQPVGPGPSGLTAPTTGLSDGRVPVVRRVLDGVRSTTSSPPSRSIQPPAATQRPTVSRPSSSPPRGTSSSISRGSTSRPSSSSSVRKPASSGQTSSKMRSSSRSRSSRSKGKPPRG